MAITQVTNFTVGLSDACVKRVSERQRYKKTKMTMIVFNCLASSGLVIWHECRTMRLWVNRLAHPIELPVSRNQLARGGGGPPGRLGLCAYKRNCLCLAVALFCFRPTQSSVGVVIHPNCLVHYCHGSSSPSRAEVSKLWACCSSVLLH